MIALINERSVMLVQLKFAWIFWYPERVPVSLQYPLRQSLGVRGGQP